MSCPVPPPAQHPFSIGMRSIALILALATTVPSPTSALSLFGIPFPVPTAPSVARTGVVIGPGSGATVIFDRLQSVEVTSVSTGEPTTLTSQWNNDEELAPIQNQKCVVEFLRHFGSVFCWERAIQLKRDVLPALKEKNIPLLVVGIGSLESGRTFAEQIDFPVSNLFVDASEETDVYRSIATRNSQRDPQTGKQVFEGIGSMWSDQTTIALKDRGLEDLNYVTGNIFQPGPYKPLMPRNIESTLVQGASFVFDGRRNMLRHYDWSSGGHVPIEELLESALSPTKIPFKRREE